MAKPLADYVKLPGLDEYKEWFKDFADLKREDGILQVTWKTKDGPMQSGYFFHARGWDKPCDRDEMKAKALIADIVEDVFCTYDGVRYDVLSEYLSIS